MNVRHPTEEQDMQQADTLTRASDSDNQSEKAKENDQFKGTRAKEDQTKDCLAAGCCIN
jgi:hypothetical protein